MKVGHAHTVNLGRKTVSLLERHGAILRGHFIGTSGRHLDTYVNKDAIYPHVAAIRRLCGWLASVYREAQIEVVAAPAIGGVILSQWVAYWLEDAVSRDVLSVYAEKDPSGRFEFRRGYDRLIAGKRGLVVEDVMTTGGSLRAVVEAVLACGGTIAGATVIVNRGGVGPGDVFPAGVEAPLVALASLDLQSWDEAECPLCRDGVPVDMEVGKGREFLERKASQ